MSQSKLPLPQTYYSFSSQKHFTSTYSHRHCCFLKLWLWNIEHWEWLVHYFDSNESSAVVGSLFIVAWYERNKLWPLHISDWQTSWTHYANAINGTDALYFFFFSLMAAQDPLAKTLSPWRYCLWSCKATMATVSGD